MYGEQVVTRTYGASIRNQPQVSDDLDSLDSGIPRLQSCGGCQSMKGVRNG